MGIYFGIRMYFDFGVRFRVEFLRILLCFREVLGFWEKLIKENGNVF